MARETRLARLQIVEIEARIAHHETHRAVARQFDLFFSPSLRLGGQQVRRQSFPDGEERNVYALPRTEASPSLNPTRYD
jgi:hypothetical protein